MCGEEEACVVHEIDGRCGGFVVAGLGVRQPCVAVDRGMQIRIADPRLLRSGLAPLGSFGLVGAAAMNAPSAALGDFSDFLDVDVDHLSWSFRDDDLRFSVVLAVRVDEPAPIQPEVPQDFRHGPASNDDAVGAQLERDP